MTCHVTNMAKKRSSLAEKGGELAGYKQLAIVTVR